MGDVYLAHVITDDWDQQACPRCGRHRPYCDCLDDLQAEVERLKNDIDYWSYCTWQGMKATCPEKKKVLRDRFASLNLSPWTYTEISESKKELEDE